MNIKDSLLVIRKYWDSAPVRVDAIAQELGVPPVGHEDVRGLDVSVDDPLRVCGFEGVGNLDREIQ